MPPKQKFSEGEKVLCFHGPLIYEARCLKVKVVEKQPKYFIHYFGWKKNWDEWVGESRVLKLNSENLQKQQQVLKDHELQMKSKKNTKAQKKKNDKTEKDNPEDGNSTSRSSTPQRERGREKVGNRGSQTPTPTPSQQITGASSNSNSTSAAASSTANDLSVTSESLSQKKKKKDVEAAAPENTPPSPSEPLPTSQKKKKKEMAAESKNTNTEPASTSKKKKRDLTVEVEDSRKPEVNLTIPDELKRVLVDDWDLIGRQKRLVNLPAKSTVHHILEDYLHYKFSSESQGTSSLREFTEGLKDYFNIMLGAQLLYKFERPQYAEMLQNHSGQEMSHLYGAMHLLRLFVKIGPMLMHANFSQKDINVLTEQIHDFLSFLVVRSKQLFNLDQYGIASPEYHRRAL